VGTLVPLSCGPGGEELTGGRSSQPGSPWRKDVAEESSSRSALPLSYRKTATITNSMMRVCACMRVCAREDQES